MFHDNGVVFGRLLLHFGFIELVSLIIELFMAGAELNGS